MTRLTASLMTVLMLTTSAVSASSTGSKTAETERESLKAGDFSIKTGTNVSEENGAGTKTGNLQKIEVDSSNIRVIERTQNQEKTVKKGEPATTCETPSGSLAASLPLADPSVITEWRPIFHFGNTRGIRLPDVQLSEDGSVLAIAETTGAHNGANGTRLVLLNTCTWEAIRVLYYDFKVSKIAFLPSSKNMALLKEKQSILKQGQGIVAVNLETGKEICAADVENEAEVSCMCGMKDTIFLARKDKAEIIAYRMTGDELKATHIQTAERVSAMSATPDGAFLGAVSAKTMTFFKLSDLKKYSAENVSLNWPPVQVRFLDSQSNYVLSPESSRNTSAVLIRGGRKIEFAGRSAGYVLTSHDGKTLYAGYQVNGQIDRVDPVSTEVLETVKLEQIKPQTIGDLRNVFYLENRKSLLCIDTNGNIYMTTRPENERRWKKAVLMTAKK